MAMTLPAWAADQQTSDESLVSFEDMPRSRPNRLDWEMLDQWVRPTGSSVQRAALHA